MDVVSLILKEADLEKIGLYEEPEYDPRPISDADILEHISWNASSELRNNY